MEKNTTNYKFLNAKDRASERKNSHGILDTDRYHYKTAPHVQTGKRKRDSDGFFTPYAMFRPYSGTGLLCAIFGETPARKTSDLRVTQDMQSRSVSPVPSVFLWMPMARSSRSMRTISPTMS